MLVLPQFLSHFNKNLVWRTKGFRTTDNYSSVHLKQTDLLSDRHSEDMGAGRPQRSCHPSFWFLLVSPFLYFLSPPFGDALCKMQNRACTHHQLVKVNANGHPLEAYWQLQVNSRICCLCLPIIQSFVRYMCVCVCVCRVFMDP